MSESPCPDCGTGMEKGFVPDFALSIDESMKAIKDESWFAP